LGIKRRVNPNPKEKKSNPKKLCLLAIKMGRDKSPLQKVPLFHNMDSHFRIAKKERPFLFQLDHPNPDSAGIYNSGVWK